MAGFLIVQRGNDIGARFNITKGLTTVGRDSENDIVLDDPYVSRYHAVFKEVSPKGEQQGGLAVIDLGSENPVLIKDTPLEAGEVHILQHREVIRIGQTVFSFQTGTAPKSTPPAETSSAPTAFAPASRESAPPAEPQAAAQSSASSYSPPQSYLPSQPPYSPQPSYAPPTPSYNSTVPQSYTPSPADPQPSHLSVGSAVPDLDDMETGEIQTQAVAKDEGLSGNSGSYGAFGSGEMSRNDGPRFMPQTPLPQVSSQEYDHAVPTVKTSDAPKEFIESAPSLPNIDDNAPTRFDMPDMDNSPTRLDTPASRESAGDQPVIEDARKKVLDPMSPDYQDFGEAKTIFIPAIRPRTNPNDH